MDIKRNGPRRSGKGPAEWFTHRPHWSAIRSAEPAHGRGARVTLEPTARTAWHTHPLGLTLIVSTGVGRVQPWAGPVEEIRPGDVVWFPPSEKHWHDAASTTDDAYRYSGGARWEGHRLDRAHH